MHHFKRKIFILQAVFGSFHIKHNFLARHFRYHSFAIISKSITFSGPNRDLRSGTEINCKEFAHKKKKKIMIFSKVSISYSKHLSHLGRALETFHGFVAKKEKIKFQKSASDLTLRTIFSKQAQRNVQKGATSFSSTDSRRNFNSQSFMQHFKNCSNFRNTICKVDIANSVTPDPRRDSVPDPDAIQSCTQTQFSVGQDVTHS